MRGGHVDHDVARVVGVVELIDEVVARREEQLAGAMTRAIAPVASGINASATTSPASTSVFRRLGDRSAATTEVLGSPASRTLGAGEIC